MLYEGFYRFFLLSVVFGCAVLGSAVFAVSRDLGDEFTYTLPERVQHLGRVETVLAARLPDPSRDQAAALSRHIVQLCSKLDFEPAFVLAVLDVESGFRPGVVSSAGAIGLMQLMPRTAAPLARQLKVSYRRFGKIQDALRDPYFNVTLGLHYMSYLRARYSGMSPYWWVAAYNLGPSRLNILRARANFRPMDTVIYYRKIRRRLSYFRHYTKSAKGRTHV